MTDLSWSTNTDWTNAQSTTNIDINSGTFELADAIPDSVVTREQDNFSFTGQTERFGLQIEPSQTWPKIGAEISGKVSGATDAEIYRVSDSALMGSADISSLSAGDTFTINLDSDLVNGETYNFVLYADGSSWDVGYYSSAYPPITSNDGNLSIVDGARNETNTYSNVLALLRVGNVGFA